MLSAIQFSLSVFDFNVNAETRLTGSEFRRRNIKTPDSLYTDAWWLASLNFRNLLVFV